MDLIRIRNCAKALTKDSPIEFDDLVQTVVEKLLRTGYECTAYYMYVKAVHIDMIRRLKNKKKIETEWYFLYRKDNPDMDNLILFKQMDRLDKHSQNTTKGNISSHLKYGIEDIINGTLPIQRAFDLRKRYKNRIK